MKLFHNSFRRMFHQECSKFRHLLELRGFLPSVLKLIFSSAVTIGVRLHNHRNNYFGYFY